MMPSILISTLFPLAVGILLVRTAWRPRADVPSLVLQFTLASGLAIAVSSCTFLAWLAVPGLQCLTLTVAEPALFMGATITLLLFRQPETLLFGEDSALPARCAPKPYGAAWGLTIGFGIVLGCALAYMIPALVNEPLGPGDAYAAWNLRAIFLFSGEGQRMQGLMDIVSRSHSDYPLLIPSSIARSWTYLGVETGEAPQMLALFFTLGTVALLWASLSMLRSAPQGLVAALFLLAAPAFIRPDSCRYSDAPLGFFILSAVALLSIKSITNGKGYGLTVLSGTMAGFAACAKDEGVLFILAVLIGGFVVLLVKREHVLWVRESSFFLAGCLPVTALLVSQKLYWAAPGDLFRSLHAAALMANAADLQRSMLVGATFGKKIIHWGNGLMAVFLGYAAAAGSRPWRRCPTVSGIGLVTLLIMLAEYYGIYVFSHHHPDPDLSVPLERLLAQLWPTFLFLAFLIVRPLRSEEAQGCQAAEVAPKLRFTSEGGLQRMNKKGRSEKICAAAGAETEGEEPAMDGLGAGPPIAPVYPARPEK